MRWLRVLRRSVLVVVMALPVVGHTQTRVEETVAATTNYPGPATITYTGKWHMTEIARNWSGGTAAASTWGPANTATSPAPVPSCRSDDNVPASKVTLSFTGTGVKWIGAKVQPGGKARVFLDGIQQVPDVDTYAATEQLQVVLFAKDGLAPINPHTLEIEALGDKNAANTSTSCIVVVDAFEIDGTPSGLLQEAGREAVTYFGTWILSDSFPSHNWSGGTAAYSYASLDPGIVPASTPEGIVDHRVTTRAVFTFRGTQVAWIGSRASVGGIAKVYVDGTAPVLVDTFAAEEQPQQVLFTSGPLTPGIHTLAIEVTDLPPEDRRIITVDAFEVTP